jgi:hypothetical protein
MFLNKNKFCILSTIILLIIFTSSIYAGGLEINSVLLNTDSANSYLNLQYGNYYDNVDLKLSFNVDSIPEELNYLPLVFSPKVYGVTYNGDLVLVEVLPYDYLNLYNPGNHQYVYNNLFYLYPQYPAYIIETNLRTIDNYYFTNSAGYVYVDPSIDLLGFNIPEDNPEDGPEDSNDPEYLEDFTLSGPQQIFLDEDEDYTYSFNIENKYNEDLEIVSITTNEPTRIDIEDIDYDYIVNSLSQEKVDISILSDTVSDDYSGELEIYVLARFPGQEDQQKQLNVNYNIEDEDSYNNGDCSDVYIDLDQLRFDILDNDISTKNIKIVNNSLDYDFEIDDIEIEEDEDNLLDIDITDYPHIIYEESEGFLELELDSDDVEYSKIINLDLDIEGDLTRENRDPKSCDLSKNLRITIKNNYSPQDQQISTDCSLIKIFTTNILQKENSIQNYSREDGFYILNNSNQKFKINSINIKDNSKYATTSKNYIENQVYANSYIPLDFDIETSSLNYTQLSKGKISISGIFDDGTICNSSSLYSYFDFTVFSNDNRCAKVGVNNKIISNTTNNSFEVFNNTDSKFYIEDYLITNKDNLNINIPSIQYSILSNSTKNIPAGFSNTGSLNLKISGSFEDGEECNFENTKPGTIISYNTYTNQEPVQHFSSSCRVQLLKPSVFEIQDLVENLDFSFLNTTTKSGKIKIRGNGLVVNPSIIYLDGEDDFTQTLSLSNYNNPKSVFFNVQLNGCEDQIFFTNIIYDSNTNKRIKFTSYPTTIKPENIQNTLKIGLENTYNEDKELLLTLSGFPSSWEIEEENIFIDARSKNTYFINFKIPSQDLNSNKVYNGYIDIYNQKYKLNSTPITVDFRKPKEEIFLDYNISSLEGIDSTSILDLLIINNSSQEKDLVIDLDLNKNKFIIEGERNINLKPDSNISTQFRILSLDNNNTLNFNILLKDADTNKIQINKEVNFQKSITTKDIFGGLLIFSNTFSYIFIILIVLLIIFFIIKKIINNKKKANKKVLNNKQLNN